MKFLNHTIKLHLFFSLALLCHNKIYGQNARLDSLKAVLLQPGDDTSRVNLYAYLGTQQVVHDSAIYFAGKGLQLAKKINFKKGEGDCLLVIAIFTDRKGNYIDAIQSALEAYHIHKKLGNLTGIATACLLLQGDYREMGEFRKALDFSLEGVKLAETNPIMSQFVFLHHYMAPLLMAEIGQIYLLLNQLDSATFFAQRAIDQNELFNGVAWGFPVYLIATIQTLRGDYINALNNYRSSIRLSIQNDFAHDTLQIYSGMSTLFRKMGQKDSAIHYASIVARDWDIFSEFKNLEEALKNLAGIYKEIGNKDSAIRYIELSYALRDSMFSHEKTNAIQRIAFSDELRQQELLAGQQAYRNRIKSGIFLGGLVIVLLIAGILWRNSRQQQMAKEKIESAYSELKATQTQLIQSEKMASLGELTAGIAHEIQNPLNFVNNFSEVSSELIGEMKSELENGKPELAVALAKDLENNLEKILFHGKRADSIVKGMLQHSSSGQGHKEPTDLNNLVDEFVRLSFHGMRAKDKSFQATLETELDPAIGKVELISQEIGRVLMNLFNNAFYSISEKSKLLGNAYQPSVTVKTRKLGKEVTIEVTDNGGGIPQTVLDKIFQPFFTTKPTGQGTGLGLSLSYDIIHAHGGKIEVMTREGEGTTFTIFLPAGKA